MTPFHRSCCLASFLGLFGLTLLGCGDRPPAQSSSVTPPPVAQATATAEDEHDHPEHGSRGGHLVEMSDGSTVEVMFADDIDMFTVYPNDAAKVSKVEMITTVDGKETTYAFEKENTFDSVIFPLKNVELSTAAQMGDAVDIKLVIGTESGEITGKFVHHEH
jgi:endonuclease YncB( thermonuclease family)